MDTILNYLESILTCQEKALKALLSENLHEYKYQMAQAEMILMMFYNFMSGN